MYQCDTQLSLVYLGWALSIFVFKILRQHEGTTENYIQNCMNSMNYNAGYYNLTLCSRNEGKIKSYESCRDVRAWSHDERARDRYLREWIKSDMPICVFPTGTLARFMRTMTYRSRGRATPRCHPDCKSKVVLESICNSCHVIKECFKNEDIFEKYYDDEEFETSHWPCERCLEALKSIKMFWKIIIEKIFNVSIPKDDLDQNPYCPNDNVRSVAKIWQTEMTQQAMYVKNISYLKNPPEFPSLCVWNGTTATANKKTAACDPCVSEDNSVNIVKRLGKVDCRRNSHMKSYRVKATDTDCLSNPLVNRANRRCSSLNSGRRLCKGSIAKAKMVDAECDCNQLDEEIDTLKTNLHQLQDTCSCQRQEIDKLRRENSSLRVELQNVYKNSLWQSTFLTSSRCTSYHDTIATLPKPFECCADENVDQLLPVKGVESEMIITMKNGKNEAYGHVSLLQVLHKTNCPDIREINLGNACSNRNEDPIELLTKVQNTFGTIMKREMGIVNNKQERESNKFAIDASFSQVNASKSTFSFSSNIIADSDSSTNNISAGRRTNANKLINQIYKNIILTKANYDAPHTDNNVISKKDLVFVKMKD